MISGLVALLLPGALTVGFILYARSNTARLAEAARLLRSTNDRAALKLYEKVAENLERRGQLESPLRAIALEGQAECHRRNGMFGRLTLEKAPCSKALNFQRAAVAIWKTHESKKRELRSAEQKLAFLLYATEQHEQAIELLNYIQQKLSAQTEQRELYSALKLMAEAQFSLGRFTDAEDSVRESIKHRQLDDWDLINWEFGHIPLTVILYLSLYRQGKFAEGLAVVDRAIEDWNAFESGLLQKYPLHKPTAQTVSLMVARGKFHLELGNARTAIADFRAALKLSRASDVPFDQTVISMVESIAREMYRHQEASSLWDPFEWLEERQADSADSIHCQTIRKHVTALLECKRLEQAEKTLRMALGKHFSEEGEKRDLQLSLIAILGLAGRHEEATQLADQSTRVN